MSENRTNSTCEEYSQTEYLIVASLHTASASVSFFATLFVILLIFLFKKYRVFVQRLILYLSVAAMLISLTDALSKVDYVVKNQITETYCVAIGFLSQYSQWTVLLAVCVLTLHIILKLRLNFMGRYETKRLLELLYVSVVFLIPLVPSGIPFIYEAYGSAGEWCWIKNTQGMSYNCTAWKTGIILQFALWWAPLFLIVLGLVIVYIGFIIQLQCEKRQYRGQFDPDDQVIRKNIRKEIRSIFWFPIIFIIFNIFPLVNRIQNAISQTPILELWILHAVVSPLQGGFIALAYSLDPETRKRLNRADIAASLRNLLKQDQGRVKEYSALVTTEGIASPYDQLLSGSETVHSYSSTVK